MADSPGGGGMFQPLEGSGGLAPGPPGTASTRLGTGLRQGTASTDASARPMTSNRGAGFSSQPHGRFDPFGQAAKGLLGGAGGGSLLPKKQEASPKEVARGHERKVHELLEASVALSQQGDAQAALERATEARKRERALAKFRDAVGQADAHPPELGFAVELQLAACYAANKLHGEALELYGALVKNRALPQGGRLRVCIGNIHYDQGRFPAAIKQYRMALDALPAAARRARGALLRNIGLAFVQLGRCADAAGAFEAALDAAPDAQAAFNLLICSYALGDREGMTAAFTRLAGLPGLAAALGGGDDDESDGEAGPPDSPDGLRDSLPSRKGHLGGDVFGGGGGPDPLKQEAKAQAATVRKCVLTGAQLLAEGLSDRGGFVAGFDWAAEQLRQAGLGKLAAEVTLAKASRHLVARQVDAAADVYRGFERRGPALRAAAATNLSCLYLLEGDLAAAAKYTDLALKTDRYNAQAHVNRGVVLLEAGSLDEARQAFSDAAAIQPLCMQALYNLGLVNLRLGEPEAALMPLRKLHGLLPDQPEVVHCLALAADMSGDTPGAIRWLEVLTSLVPHDPGVLCKLGAIYHRLEEEARSLGYYSDAQRVWPANLDVISWLGAYHVRGEVYERAVPLFELAAAIQPQEAKWGLMAASCYRRIGAYGQALARYRSIVAAHPGNVEALRYLVALATELGRGDEALAHGDALRRAKRAEAAAAAAAAASAGASAGAPGHARGEADDRDGGGGIGSLDSHLAARNRRPTAGQAAQPAGGDDWGEEPLGEDLLPM
ncbi:Ift88 [Scenedesmus sp. PABB004]|nr:Ift88 [Scenedesmus sp. PABB004]